MKIEKTTIIGKLNRNWFEDVSETGVFSVKMDDYYRAVLKNGLINWQGPEDGKPGKSYWITIEEIEVDHSRAQNNYFHALARHWAKFNNWPFEKTKKLLKLDFGKVDFIEHPDKGLVAEIVSLRDYSKAELASLIDKVEALCIENGLDIEQDRLKYDTT